MTLSDEMRALPPSELGWTCPPEWLGFKTTSEITSYEEVTPQSEAIAALRLALRVHARGYNVYVAGMPGTGRTSTVRRILENERHDAAVPDDLLYVHNLQDPRSPSFLRLPAGRGRALRDGMAGAADRFRQGLAGLRASSAHRRRRERVARRFREQQTKLIGEFQEEVAHEGFALVEVSLGQMRRHELAPLVESQPVSLADLSGLVREGKLTRETAEEMRRKHAELAARLARSSGLLRDINQELEEALAEADREAARPLIEETLAEVRGTVGLSKGENPPLDAYFDAVEEYLLQVFPLLFSAGEAGAEGGDEDGGGDPFEALRVNVIVDRTGQSGRPVVEEAQPTPARLLGHIDVQRGGDGSVRADLAGIRAGALHHADGGFLLINAHDLVAEESGWLALRRALRSGRISMVVGVPDQGPPPLVPHEAPLDVTVILVGSPALRDALAQGDDEFGKLFKVTALLEDRLPLTREVVESYAKYLARVAAEEKLLPFDASAVSRLLEFMVRVGGIRGKISTRYRVMTDLGREAAWHAAEGGFASVGREQVERALEARRQRQGMLSSRILEAIQEGTLLLELTGRRVGQINGLAVVETALERFGYPVRITATTAVGRSGIIDIEREADLSGEIHTKASLILAGYLRSRFAQRVPLAMTASICFEQSYGGVEGDSASCAELVALLSAIGEMPLRQDLAITGAVDQQGNVLAVGGVNEKVEGFWRVCRDAGLTGTQGVIIPAASVPTLQLSTELVAAAAAGRFRIHAIRRVSEAVELMTGTPLGDMQAGGEWPTGSLGERIAMRLADMAHALRAYGPPA